MSIYGLVLRFLSVSKPLLPARWRLPIRYRGLLNSATVEPELAYLYSICRHFRTAVDVGANHGFYSYKMAKRFQDVYAFEPNGEEDFDIQYFKKNNIHFFPYGLSNQNQKAELHIPIKHGTPYTGWASVEKRDLDFAESVVSTPIELQRLDDQAFVKTHTVDLIKIDVEGHELEVLLGGLETIRRDKPVLIIENNEAQAAEINAVLEELGYRQYTFAALTGKSLASPNLIYLPR